jgi:hypothetical protein
LSPRRCWELLAPPIHPASSGSQQQTWVLGSSSCGGAGVILSWCWVAGVVRSSLSSSPLPRTSFLFSSGWGCKW